jgi:hypothetical protein
LASAFDCYRSRSTLEKTWFLLAGAEARFAAKGAGDDGEVASLPPLSVALSS